jgi:dimethylglycine dehydrogenase
MGFLLSGPKSRDVLARLTAENIGNADFAFLTCRRMEIGLGSAVVARLSITGELGYEINVPASRQRALLSELVSAGEGLGLRLIGDRALDSLRLEKSYGVWSREYAQSYTPAMSGLDRFVAFDKGQFIGRDEALRARQAKPSQVLVTLAIEAADADANGYEPIWLGKRRVGFVTSGAFGHHVGQSLAMGYVSGEVAHSGERLSVDVVGEPRPARVLPAPLYDPAGERLRA